MKKIVLILWMLCSVLMAQAQRYSFSTMERITAGGITYELEKTPVSYVFTNVLNKLGDMDVYVNMDGTQSEKTPYDCSYGELTDDNAFRRAIRASFTPEELEALKQTNTFIGFHLIFSHSGELLEVSFMHVSATSVVKALPYERFATLEKNLKKMVTATMSDPDAKGLQFVGGGLGFKFAKLPDVEE